MRTVRVAIAGFGKLGYSIAQLILSRRSDIASKYHVKLNIVAVWRSSKGQYNDAGLEQDDLEGEMQDGQCGVMLLEKSNPDILFETGPSDFKTGGASLEYLCRAIIKGCHIICISKGALVYDGANLYKLANVHGSILKLSGAAGAALPCIDILKYSTIGCKVSKIQGTLNATSNYILDFMMVNKVSFEEAKVQIFSNSLEVAEPDPKMDYQGWDTACKVVLIAVFGLGISITMSDLMVSGLEGITADQVRQWHEQNEIPRLVGTIEEDKGIWKASVKLKTYSANHPFALVQGRNKGILITTDLMGDIFASAGGPEPGATAASALKDLEVILMEMSPL